MKLVLTQEALSDLAGIDAHLFDRSPQGLVNVIESIKHTLDVIESMPRIGRKTQIDNLHIFYETKYNHIIPYYLKGDTIWVLRVYDSRRPPLDIESLRLP